MACFNDIPFAFSRQMTAKSLWRSRRILSQISWLVLRGQILIRPLGMSNLILANYYCAILHNYHRFYLISVSCREATKAIQQLMVLDNLPEGCDIDQPESIPKVQLRSLKTCPLCDRVFRSNSYLKLHLRRHTGR